MYGADWLREKANVQTSANYRVRCRLHIFRSSVCTTSTSISESSLDTLLIKLLGQRELDFPTGIRQPVMIIGRKLYLLAKA